MSHRVRAKAPVKYAGIYHYGTGKWTRPGAQSTELGGNYNIIYNNTCSSPAFGAIYPNEFWTDEGRIPGTNSPNKIFNETQTSATFVGAVNECPEGPSSAPGSAKGSAAVGGSYSIDGFQIGYCSNVDGALSTPAGAGASMTIDFRDATALDGARCAAGPIGAPAPVASFSLASFPGRGTGPVGCWVVSLDLAAASFSFPLKADGNGNYASPTRSADLEHCFSWTFSFPGAPAPTTTAASGFIMAGVPANLGGTNGWAAAVGGAACSGYDGTVWDRNAANAAPRFPTNGSSGTFAVVSTPSFAGGGEDGTGMTTQDSHRVDLIPATPTNGCYFFGGPAVGAPNPFSSFHLELYTQNTTTPAATPATGFCFGDGCAFTCPCVAPNTVPDPQGHHESGCANAFDLGGATLSATGNATLPTSTLAFSCFIGTNFGGFAFLVKGNAQTPNGVFPSPSDGVRCASGALVRFGAHNAGTNGATLGSWTYPNTAQTTPVSAATAQAANQNAYYQLFYRHAFGGFCNSATTDFSNGLIVKWP